MKGKVSQLSRTPLGQTILGEVSHSSGIGTIFSSKLPQIPKFEGIPVTREKTGYTQLLGSLSPDKDLRHRGMAGFAEPESIARHGKFGKGNYEQRNPSLNIAKFIEKPKSRLLLSTSPDPHTVREYMVGYQLIKAKGAIATIGMPAVILHPQVVSLIDVEHFKHYQDIIDEQLKLGNRTRSEDIFDLAQGNNETTAVLGATPEDEWHPTLRHLHTLKLVKNASGRILQGFTKTEGETFDVVTITNPDFCKNLMSLELFTTASGKGAMFGKYLDRMNKRAQELGLITDDRRILTMDDVCALMRSSQYQELLDNFTTTGKTKVLGGVPKDIPIGAVEPLLEYVTHEAELIPGKIPIPPTTVDSSLHL
ncbi:Uncharacterised protein [Legionella steigerwaltii]|uniref:Uncharacterized protein n=1 Tax=Legionella steigerwaltii TaxID=460 RepID=A0A378LBJ3_9GAMM|nr:hypothetical protein [Legionella steigerwaltii]KTD69791.1 hypothetical protein Lstg_3410 [Legionella steigerwaltii]STY21451.1 Uncharacterised protein [Legionella steigerwaltii]